MIWDYVEGNPFSESSGNLGDSIDWIAKVVERVPSWPVGHVEQRDAVDSMLTDGSFCAPILPITTMFPTLTFPITSTSGYATHWARVYCMLFSTVLVPKTQELVADPFRHGGRKAACEFFERG